MKEIRWGIVGPGIIASYEEMAASDKVDAVYISTPHPFHKPCDEIFLRAKKHVLCEKPMCVNKREAESLCALAKAEGVFFMEAMWTRFIPAICELEKIIKSGEIGEILDIRADFCYASTPLEEAKLFLNHMAGGSLLDVGVYGLHFVSLFFGAEPEEIKAAGKTEDGVDLHTKVLPFLALMLLTGKAPVTLIIFAVCMVSAILSGILLLCNFITGYFSVFGKSGTAAGIYNMAALLGGYFLLNMATAARTNWFMQLVADDKRGKFTAFKEAISLVSGMVFMFLVGSLIDYFDAVGNTAASMIFLRRRHILSDGGAHAVTGVCKRLNFLCLAWIYTHSRFFRLYPFWWQLF